MSPHRKYCTPDFVFEQVFTQPYVVIYPAVLVGIVPAVLFYVLFIRHFFKHVGLALSLGIVIIIVSLITSLLSKTVRIYFDEKSIFISDSQGDFTRYLKREIAGIYCYDYETNNKPNVSITIILTNGKRFDLNSINLFERPDQAKAQMLRQFFTAAKKRLHLTYVRKNRWRGLQGLGANWYVPLRNDLLGNTTMVI
ncbi:hypothetical protein GCM10023149_33030 [Mucilaginibacter gynuensis]|uniref:Transmembrane protein n=1 Tax=Mucilaginibacter gynuensis TaxID=1302236 RepID=A0ABP8GRX0_9SPHI